MSMSKSGRKKLAVIGIRGFPGVQGGVESHCQQLIPRLADGMDCRVYRRRPYLTKDSAEEIQGIEFKDLPSTRKGGFETGLHTFLSVLHLMFHRVDVVNIHNIGPGMFAPLIRMMGMKVVLTYHSPNYEHDKWSATSKLLLRFCEKLALGFSSHIIFVSPKQRDRYSDKIKAKSTAIPNGITPLGRNSGTSFLDRFGLEKQSYILAVGRITPEKGFDNLVRAVNLSNSGMKLVIAGASDHSDDFFKKLKKADSANLTVFTGFTTGSDLAQLYTHAALYVLSSHNEGFPMVLLEAMSHDLKIVSTDIPAAHIIELPPNHYCRHDDPADMVKAIDRVLAEKDNPTYDLADYDWDRIADQTIAVYEAVITKK